MSREREREREQKEMFSHFRSTEQREWADGRRIDTGWRDSKNSGEATQRDWRPY